MKKLSVLLVIVVYIIGLTNIVNAQEDCKVLLEPIKGTYTGDCKKGLANGEGTAIGTDSYTGKFKKGLPHGEGVYTFSTGEIYVGSFKDGQKSGMGKLKLADGTIAKEGLWKEDQFFREQDVPDYKIGMRRNVVSITIRDLGGDDDKIDIILSRDGRESTENVHDLMVVANSGVEQRTQKSIVYREMMYPFKANVKFKSVGKFTPTTAGDTKMGEKNSFEATQMPESVVDFEILEKGNWEVRIKY